MHQRNFKYLLVLACARARFVSPFGAALVSNGTEFLVCPSTRADKFSGAGLAEHLISELIPYVACKLITRFRTRTTYHARGCTQRRIYRYTEKSQIALDIKMPCTNYLLAA